MPIVFSPAMQDGRQFVFGRACDPMAKIDIPKGAYVRLRFRVNEFARAFVRTKHEIAEHYLLIDKNGNYSLGEKIASNFRASYAGVVGRQKGPVIQRVNRIIRYRPMGRKLCLPAQEVGGQMSDVRESGVLE
jgi:hypothetical protein